MYLRQFFAIFVLSFFCYESAYAAKWKIFKHHDEKKTTTSYDEESIVKYNGVTRVWTKTKYMSEDEAANDYSLTLYEIKCQTREWRIMESTFYLKEPWHVENDPKKNYIDIEGYPSRWHFLKPIESTMISILFTEACKKKEKKSK